MPPQSTAAPFASEIGSSIYKLATATATATATSPSTSASTFTSTFPSTFLPSATPNTGVSDDDDGSDRAWSNYLYIIVVFTVILLVFGFLYQRRRRSLAAASSFSRTSRYQAFHTHHPSQSRDLSAVQANNRVWRNMRAGPFSHHARTDSATGRRPGTASTTNRSRVDVDEEIPPPYIVTEPERTLERGPTTRDTTRDDWLDRSTRNDVNLANLSPRNVGGSISKPPGYEERENAGRNY